jgi:signal transduction histidine kinase
MVSMTTSGARPAVGPARRHSRWSALVLPPLAAGTYSLFPSRLSWLLVLLTITMVVLIPRFTAKLAPFALFAYGVYGIFLAHALTLWNVPGHVQQVIYGVVRVGPADNAAYVLPQAIVILAAGVWLLAVTGAPGSRAVRHASAQLRGANGQPKTVPPLLLLPVTLLWEELLSQRLWFDWFLNANAAGRVLAVVIVAVGVAVVVWLPRAAAVTAVLGTVVLGLAGLVMSLRLALPVSTPTNGLTTVFYGALTLHGKFYGAVTLDDGLLPAGAGGMVRVAGQDGTLVLLLTAAQGLALLAVGCLLAPRLPAWTGDAELAGHTRALTQRVTRLTETRSDAAETAVAELSRIERDLHDGAQARLVAVGMSLRAAEELMPVNPEAALALVAEARETSSRALDDLRDLVRGIYPPVLADRGLPDAIRALALDAPLTVGTDIDLPGEPPTPVAAAAYFAIAEALTNAVRHADAATVQVTLAYAGGMLRATVTDDGHGGADPAKGTGLAGVERRLATFDGILAVSSPPGGPTIIAIEIPYGATESPRAATYGGLAEVVRSSWQTRTLI